MTPGVESFVTDFGVVELSDLVRNMQADTSAWDPHCSTLEAMGDNPFKFILMDARTLVPDPDFDLALNIFYIKVNDPRNGWVLDGILQDIFKKAV